MMEFDSRSDKGEEGNKPEDGVRGYQPSEDWLSPYSGEFERGTLELFDKIRVEHFQPQRWELAKSPVSDTRLLLMPHARNGSFIIGAGELPDGLPAKDAIAAVAGSAVKTLHANGVEIPVVFSVPIHSKIEAVDATHMLNFPAMVPGALVGSREKLVPMFKMTTVHAIDNQWVSLETCSWGKGCDPQVEIDLMSKLHNNLDITKIGDGPVCP